MKDHRWTRFKLTRFYLVALSIISAGILTTGCRRTQQPEQIKAPANQVLGLEARQAATFISYNNSIALTSAQQKTMDEALSSIPAPCCAKYSMATCCCPCNLAKAAWGLSKYLIAEQHYGAPEVKKAVDEWLHVTNPAGYTGDACFTGGCNRSFANNGCGGMDERKLISGQ